MSTGLDCYFEEKKPGEWWLYLEEMYGHKLDIEYDEYGPFPTFEVAHSYLNKYFANPGGYAVYSHPESTDKSWQLDTDT